MKFLSIEPFVPSGSNFDGSKQIFQALGFTINWEDRDYVGFERDGCRFILQRYDQPDFAQNFMLSVRVSDIDEFWREVNEKHLPETFGIRVSPPTAQPYGREVNVIDIAGVCWHFVE